MELPAGDQVGKVEPERGHVLGQILVALLEADEQARLSEFGRAAHQEGHGQQGLAAAGAAAGQSRPPLYGAFDVKRFPMQPLHFAYPYVRSKGPSLRPAHHRATLGWLVSDDWPAWWGSLY